MQFRYASHLAEELHLQTLMQNDVLATIEPCIMSKDPQTMATTVEMFVMIVEFNPQIARDYLLQQGRNLSDAKNVCTSFSYYFVILQISVFRHDHCAGPRGSLEPLLFILIGSETF